MTQTLGELGPEAKDFRLFMITVDPERDTAGLLKEYVGNFDSRMEGLVPTPDELKAVARAFRAYYDKQPTSDGSYTMSHTAMIYLMDRDGNFVTVIPYGDTPEGRLDKMRKLLGKAG
jgi:protein SCO1/2